MDLRTPLDERTVRSLHVGDLVTVSGTVVTGRDEMHLRTLETLRAGDAVPMDLSGAALYHCGPIVSGDRLVAAGPTTSARMDSIEAEFIARTGVRAIIGKGGMSHEVSEAMREHGCVYLAATGGAAVSLARDVEVKGVHWMDLGMPEAMWVLETDRMGPLVVAMDSHGESLYEGVRDEVARNMPRARSILGL